MVRIVNGEVVRDAGDDAPGAGNAQDVDCTELGG